VVEGEREAVENRVANSEVGRSQETRRVWNRFYRVLCRLVQQAWRKELPDGAKAYYRPELASEQIRSGGRRCTQLTKKSLARQSH
jgi:hypothetical protein